MGDGGDGVQNEGEEGEEGGDGEDDGEGATDAAADDLAGADLQVLERLCARSARAAAVRIDGRGCSRR